MLIDNKSIYIKVRKLNSAYGYANRKVLDAVQMNRTIGASVTSVNKMIANPDEQAAIMKDIIAMSPNSTDWNRHLADYWRSLSYDIPENGKELEIGFIYDFNAVSKQEYIKQVNSTITKESAKLTSDESLLKHIENRISEVNLKFDDAIKTSKVLKNELARVKAQDAAYKFKYQGIITIESDRFKFGTPIAPFEYMLYRYCLVYGDVANDKDVMSKSKKIRFYLHSDADIKREKSNTQKNERSRISALLKVTESTDDVIDMLYAMGESHTITEDDVNNYELVEKLSHSRRVDFLRIANDGNLTLVGVIEKYIAKGILSRSEGSTAIFNPINMELAIGHTMEETIGYFKNKVNNVTVSDLAKKYKNLAD